MSARHLLISNPPHGEVDSVNAAPYFSLTAAEVQMKANYGLPEVWFAGEHEIKLQDTAAALDAAGLNTALVDGDDLIAVPGQTPAESFTFKDGGLWVEHEDSERTMAYDTPVLAVLCQPRVNEEAAKAPARSVASQLSSWGRPGARRRSLDGSQDELGSPPFLDLYVPSDAGLIRISIVQEITDFSMLRANLPHGLSAMQNLVAECEERFENIYVDRRLVDMTIRGIARVVTGATQPPRTGFSFATEALIDLLSALSPGLSDIPQADLSSRLAYLTNRSRIS